MKFLGKFLGKLFGTEKALSEIVEGASKGIDALAYTPEEKANDAAKDRTEARKMVVQWMAATQGQNLARRLIALSITSVWLFMYMISALLRALAVFVNDVGVVTSAKLFKAGLELQAAAQDMNPAVMLILAFYFAAPHMGDIAKAVTGKFSQSINKS